MLETVIAFGFVISIFEFVIITMIPVRLRLRLLGSESAKLGFHIGMFVLNMVVHWGTAVGTMSATLAFIGSIATISIAARIFGCVKEDRFYHLGFIKYSVEEIK